MMLFTKEERGKKNSFVYGGVVTIYSQATAHGSYV